ncbi:hypothetical protein [Hyphomicrobium sp. MC1]|uniref:hypothetical protein n=1 Tax=Hyphomicrobium sp. (strain MC1) TaxID=717785 RepID=UPI000213E1AD|nr:hypothetical protein [Hyphomicrobium sp. MC1]CCB65229.1 conserved membrane protein of unknown function [Hyphomicrobium sp. MC1]
MNFLKDGRALALVAGVMFALGGLTILLDKELTSPLGWQSGQWLTILTVAGTISAGHLMADAVRARHWFAAIGFLVLFLSGTALVVYSSVGRQAETQGTTTLSVEDTNKKIVEKNEDLEAAKQRKAYADSQVQKEVGRGGCGRNCRDWQRNAKDVEIVIEQLEREIAALGPQKPVNAKAVAMAEIAMLLHVPGTKDQIVAALVLLMPFATTLFFEVGSIVAFGFAFRTSRKVEAVRPATSESSVPVPANDKAVSEKSTGIPGNPPAPPKGPRRRGRKADKTVVDFSERFRERNGRAPSGGEIKAAFPELPTSTAYDYSQRARMSA